ncbi:MAG: substrate-binding domain-containing protein [Chloroflexi bacterium]|nr:substrate-binding domain-containing protein [Chloroflexota bacterium]
MRYIIRWAGLLSLLLLTINPGLAQEADSIDVIGSGIVNPLIEALAEQGEHAPLDIRTTGSATGIDRFCNGDIDLATAIRPMSAGEKAICGSNEVSYSELLIAHHIVAFIAHPASALECLSATNLETALKPTASDELMDWSLFDPELTDVPLTLVMPSDDRVDYLILDRLVAGDGLRGDIMPYSDSQTALDRVAETAGALGIVPWSQALQNNPAVNLLDFDGDDSGACASPSVLNVEADSYPAVLSMYLIVNQARLADKESLAEFMRFVTDSDNASLILAAGLTPPSEATYELNAKLLTDDPSSAGAVDFLAPSGLSGRVMIVGSANAAGVIERVASALSQDNASLEIVQDFAGRANGLAALCAGEADIALLDADLTDGDLELCAASGIATLPTTLGSQATILIGNAADEHARCLSTGQINTIWRAESAGTVSNWSDVDPSFPDLGMTLFGMSLLDQSTDILLQTAGEVTPPIRRDTEKDFSPLYRAAAVGNVPGALTYMDWTDYQRVLDNDQANIQAVQVDGGAGCVAPASANIEDGSYALSRPASLLISQKSLSEISAQSFLWTLFDAENWPDVEQEGFIGRAALELPSLRLELQGWFAEAEAIYLAADAMSESAADSETAEDESGSG